MAFSFGFYNSIGGDRKYNAIQMSMIFDGIIRDGIYMHIGEQFIVKASTESNTVLVSPGRAWFNHTWNYNDADLPVVGDSPELIMDRIDALVIDVWANDEVRTNQIKWVAGAPAASPARPTLINDDENLHWQYPLAYVRRRAMATEIVQADITNMVGSTECPFVTGVLETMDIGNLLLQWQDQWKQFVKDYEETAVDWIEEQKADFINFYAEFKLQLEDFKKASEEDFNEWYAGIQGMLSGDVALNLTQRLNELTELEFCHYYGMLNETTVINKETGDITTTSEESVSTTSFATQNGNKVITTTVIPTKGSWNYKSTTTFVSSGMATTIGTVYERIAKGS